MNETTEKTEAEQKVEHKEVKINLTRWGKNKKEVLENLSFVITIISAIVFAIGILIGSFIQGTIFLSVFSSLFIMVGIVIYILSQFMGVDNG